MTVVIVLSSRLRAQVVAKMLVVETYELALPVLFIFSKSVLVPISVFHAREFFHIISVVLTEQLFLLDVFHVRLHFY